ncbi:hypothetical protein P152DRAFT_281475 [Eremomyces bilateralis CBS 781.70]|uniref:G-patch domain-containing protein n=1 Tax=Eremomyces bilateralis CBS 781.70 TaxID=1392243 RepID=A0A6G1G9S0_9PEZI|nr:uncharacterized protein P152DRAFT_281475 [Eremomyces bilateralis CBS 781.70]KAF1814609.1 hypothetical protein P152DRAFT_281475 [Eremomyces bilateralis CBS 781.70]
MASSEKSSAPKIPGGGLSLYAHLLDPKSKEEGGGGSGVISRGPVIFKKDEQTEEEALEAAKKQNIAGDCSRCNPAAALRFQPMRRPQVQKAKVKPAFPKVPTAPAQATAAQASSDGPAAPAIPRSTLADWAGEEEDDDYAYVEKKQQQRKKKRKKNKHGDAPLAQNWDDIYDPMRPNNYQEYRKSDEQYRAISEWKQRLHAHQLARRRSASASSDEGTFNRNARFAPPSNYNFAPPPNLDATADETMGGTSLATGDDAYLRRMRLSGVGTEAGDEISISQPTLGQQNQVPDIPPPPSSTSPLPPPPPSAPSGPPPEPNTAGAIIARAPVRYNLPLPPSNVPSTDAELQAAINANDELDDAPPSPSEEPPARSNRPGQAGFAERLLRKQGWAPGQGLGAEGTGITKALHVKVEKRKVARTDEEGVVSVSSSSRGKIIGGKKGKAAKEEESEFGKLSEVVRLDGMLAGMSREAIVAEEAEGMLGEIGEECGAKYGRVERVFVDKDGLDESGGMGAPVFVKFTAPLSALRAVNALEGRIFNGNKIKARFFDVVDFEKGKYS